MAEAQPTWMRPAEAVVRLSPVLGDDDAAKRLLAGRLKDGTISASCKYLTRAADVGRVPSVYVDEMPVPDRKDPDSDVIPFDPGFPTVSETNVGTGYVYWESGPPRLMNLVSIAGLSSNWAQDMERWDWQRATFVFGHPPIVKGKGSAKLPLRLRFGTRTVMYGVRFAQADVLRIVQDFERQRAAASTSNRPQPRRRRMPRKADWAEINSQLAAFTYVHDLDEKLSVRFQEPGWDTALRNWINNRLNERNVFCDETTIQSEVDRIADAIRREKVSQGRS